MIIVQKFKNGSRYIRQKIQMRNLLGQYRFKSPKEAKNRFLVDLTLIDFQKCFFMLLLGQQNISWETLRAHSTC